MSPSISIDEWIANFQRCSKILRPIVKRFGAETCHQAIEAMSLAMNEKRRVGRPADIEPAHLMDVWLFVEVGKARMELSANAFCKVGSFTWYTAGDGGPKANKALKGATLRRRYQQAVAWLKAESEPYKKNAAHGSRAFASGISPTEEWLRKELQARLQRPLSGNSVVG